MRHPEDATRDRASNGSKRCVSRFGGNRPGPDAGHVRGVDPGSDRRGGQDLQRTLPQPFVDIRAPNGIMGNDGCAGRLSACSITAAGAGSGAIRRLRFARGENVGKLIVGVGFVLLTAAREEQPATRLCVESGPDPDGQSPRETRSVLSPTSRPTDDLRRLSPAHRNTVGAPCDARKGSCVVRRSRSRWVHQEYSAFTTLRSALTVGAMGGSVGLSR